ncbi:MmcQ/YjbR family DNA-binding protein [Brachybacterium paraconglomeratum]|uniref:MmcQ/YjbR family DNA-binding protein n=1 Tax=Brachybacterium paraconglomeratum TaxID=173362 RepID=UPI00223BB471|nr:MmcQ/YjbR family DNA-binding protein [Brachybacterium paraconglomeratum]MCT1438514.1 MmcQ/YjbR family DNA-binding protein [Brachybacterium paraconglomeratum]
MDGTALQQVARARAEELPAAKMTLPFGPDYDVAKVLGKMFLLLTEVKGTPVAVVKAEPRDAEALRGAHPEITPGYHMNKRHWITLSPGGLEAEFVRELVTDSYLLVVETLPRARRPVDPHTFLAAEGGTGSSSTDAPAT